VRYSRLDRVTTMPWLEQLQVRIHPNDDLSRAVYISGLYEPSTLLALQRLLRPGARFIDVGANAGLYSMVASRWVGAHGHVHAFEPSELFTQCFERNVRAKNVTLHRVALGEEQASVQLETVAENSGATHVRPGAVGSVRMRRLDDYALENLDLLKVDVEGYERRVLLGARETLLRCRPVVIVEQKDFASRYGDERFGAAEFLLSLGAQQLGAVVQDLILGWADSPAVSG
jgi:FkbM family methyltransferase